MKESDYVIVLDPPEAPLQRSGTNRRKMVIFAGFLGIGLGMGLGLVIEFIKENQEKVKQILDLILKNLSKQK